MSSRAIGRLSVGIVAAGCLLGVLPAACSLASFEGLTCDPGSCPGDAPDTGPTIEPDASTADNYVPPIPPQPDPDGLGDGHMGSKTVTMTENINSYTSLTFDASAGATSIDIDVIGPLVDGDRLLVWQTVTEEPLASTGTLDLDAFRAGTYELARVKHVTPTAVGATVELEAPLAHAYAKEGAQVVRVAEYTDLTVQKGGAIAPPAWNGKVGGIVAALVRGTLRVDGPIIADALGLRGGVTYQNNGPYNCGTQDGLWKDGYAGKGEGLVRSAFYPVGRPGDPSSFTGGRPNATTGGGGGVCHNAGAGGGGNGSAGGQGGRDYDGNGVGRDVGGLGGVAVTFKAKDRLLLGGGGGSGERHAAIDTTGGNGGGVIFMRAHDLVSNAMITANGAVGAATDHDGAAGGGAGGTIALSILEAATCTDPITAIGGPGGSTTMSNVGPGGGGGGGHVMFAAKKHNCTFDVSSGLAGKQANAAAAPGPHYGATPQSVVQGIIEPP